MGPVGGTSVSSVMEQVAQPSPRQGTWRCAQWVPRFWEQMNCVVPQSGPEPSRGVPSFAGARQRGPCHFQGVTLMFQFPEPPLGG